MSRWFIAAGLLLLAIGLLLHFAPWLLQWFGRLPGDIHIKNERSQIFVPVTSMILVSVVLTLVLNLFNR